ncbi:hypothetical protein LMANV2_470027 [Leptospira interrogans serovar Manilae]|uniref:Uncharacterized protein n=1 Tax=Leptospira interrogans serovar Manilae TaxID=214675 RepID=A0AAQ1NZ76_LEPIR|nr:hypothetical protein LMANV2_470027 [Leptospira interrogans serovar Manilae]
MSVNKNYYYRKIDLELTKYYKKSKDRISKNPDFE